MKILIVSDLKSNRRWYQWLYNQAPRYDYIAIAGNLIKDTLTEEECDRDMSMVEKCVTAIEEHAGCWIAEGNGDHRPWPWLWSHLGLKLLTNAVVYTQAFRASENDQAYYDCLGRQWAAKLKIPFFVIAHEPPTSLAPDIAIVGPCYVDGEHRWFFRAGDTLELSPGVTNYPDAPAHIVLDLGGREAIRFDWEGIHRIKLDA